MPLPLLGASQVMGTEAEHGGLSELWGLRVSRRQTVEMLGPGVRPFMVSHQPKIPSQCPHPPT